MLSRVADSLYWIGRYAERTQTNAHILYAQLEYMLESSRKDVMYDKEWVTVLKICGYLEDYQMYYQQGILEDMVHYLVYDSRNLDSLVATITSVRMNARNTRDCMPNELWEEWNDLYLDIQEGTYPEAFSLLNTTNFLTRIRKTTLTATGIIDSLMTRDIGYRFLKIGKWLERSEKTALILHHLLEVENELEPDRAIRLGLQLTNTVEEYAYRSRVLTVDSVLKFLISDLKCSRSVAYGLHKIKDTVYDIEQGLTNQNVENMYRALDELIALTSVDVTALTLAEQKQWVKNIRQGCINFGPILAQAYYLAPPIMAV
ncbi:alpha-E domain-containing protein [Lysinibacillus piscis]|uniref:DUF403 domain-containing protein n=1 Tax=Lysinibacillus piscis TaxID=2518931 RepID=A0ABQ5NMM3_9BACI|nr:alpha-E domain-containing protein [Lysinibacillus sp. KH24]GLC89626.1 hypothetical protein LYSBPC_27530 [Lysinibacillus sp. KH24]